MNDYYQANLFVGIGQIEEHDIPLCCVGLSNVTSLHASFLVYGFGYFYSTLPVTYEHGVSAMNMTTLSTGKMTVGHQGVNDGCPSRFE